jgi:hypothetical protein
MSGKSCSYKIHFNTVSHLRAGPQKELFHLKPESRILYAFISPNPGRVILSPLKGKDKVLEQATKATGKIEV